MFHFSPSPFIWDLMLTIERFQFLLNAGFTWYIAKEEICYNPKQTNSGVHEHLCSFNLKWNVSWIKKCPDTTKKLFRHYKLQKCTYIQLTDIVLLLILKMCLQTTKGKSRVQFLYFFRFIINLSTCYGSERLSYIFCEDSRMPFFRTINFRNHTARMNII